MYNACKSHHMRIYKHINITLIVLCLFLAKNIEVLNFCLNLKNNLFSLIPCRKNNNQVISFKKMRLRRMKCALVALNIEMSWKVYHKAVRRDKQEGGASLACGSSTASSAAHTGPLGHRAAGCDGPASPGTELFTTFLNAEKCPPSAAQQATCKRVSGYGRGEGFFVLSVLNAY